MGSRSRCTPSRETSGPPACPRSPAILSSSSMKMMPWFSTRSSDSLITSSMSTSFLSSSSTMTRRASGTFTVRRFFRFGIISCSISVKLMSAPSIPCGGWISSIIGKLWGVTSISTSRSSRPPSASICRSFSRERLRRSSSALAAASGFAWPSIRPRTPSRRHSPTPCRPCAGAAAPAAGAGGEGPAAARRPAAPPAGTLRPRVRCGPC